jgi:hypothetical protein
VRIDVGIDVSFNVRLDVCLYVCLDVGPYGNEQKVSESGRAIIGY